MILILLQLNKFKKLNLVESVGTVITETAARAEKILPE